MPKKAHIFSCQQCGATSSKWTGRCESCGEWNSLVEEAVQTDKKAVVDRSKGTRLSAQTIDKVAIDAISGRISTGFEQLDAVLGGGLMPGGVSLLAGQPGMGKSTILLQVALQVAQQKPVLYVSGEESSGQVKLRAQRIASQLPPSLSLASSTSADDIATSILAGEYSFVVVDSMQTVAMAEIASAPGTVSQITNSANIIIRAAKSSNTSVVLVGHVTKEGSIAGPKVLEHLVDVVLSFEGDRYGGFKLIRAAKNRYGSTGEVAILEMHGEGLKEAENASASLLSERGASDGSVVFATMEGNRPLLVEIQALVNSSHFGYPKRTASGFDINRLTLLVAVLEKRTKLKLSDKDIFINVVGGLKLTDPASDLAICMAIASAASEMQVSDDAVVFGEVGLGGEVRRVVRADARIREAQKLGFRRAIAPKQSERTSFIEPVSNLRDVLNTYLSKK